MFSVRDDSTGVSVCFPQPGSAGKAGTSRDAAAACVWRGASLGRRFALLCPLPAPIPSFPRECSQREEMAKRSAPGRAGLCPSSGKEQHPPGTRPHPRTASLEKERKTTGIYRVRKDSEVAAYGINNEKQPSQSVGRAKSWENKPQPCCTTGSNSTAGSPKKSIHLLGCLAGANRPLFRAAGMLTHG